MVTFLSLGRSFTVFNAVGFETEAAALCEISRNDGHRISLVYLLIFYLTPLPNYRGTLVKLSLLSFDRRYTFI